jgi:sodium transport system permease protein
VQTVKTYAVFTNDREAAAPILKPLVDSKRYTLHEFTDPDEIDQLLKLQVADIVLEFPAGFERASSAGKLPKVGVVMDPNEQSSQLAAMDVTNSMEAYLAKERDRRLVAGNLEPADYEAFKIERRLAETGQAFGGSMLVGFLPYLNILWAFYGGFSIVSDLGAGEKEKGTL